MPELQVQTIGPEAILNVSDVAGEAEPIHTDNVCFLNEDACEFSNLRGTKGRVLIDKNVSKISPKLSW